MSSFPSTAQLNCQLLYHSPVPYWYSRYIACRLDILWGLELIYNLSSVLTAGLHMLLLRGGCNHISGAAAKPEWCTAHSPRLYSSWSVPCSRSLSHNQCCSGTWIQPIQHPELHPTDIRLESLQAILNCQCCRLAYQRGKSLPTLLLTCFSWKRWNPSKSICVCWDYLSSMVFLALWWHLNIGCCDIVKLIIFCANITICM